MNDGWIAERMRAIEMSGIRKVFDLAKSLKDPINLSIGQPDFDVPDPVKDAAVRALRAGHNGYTVTQGIAELREAILADVRRKYNHPDRQVLVTSGTSGAMLLALLCTVNPGDEVILFDPYFVAYPHWVTLAGGKAVILDTYPDFRIDPDKVQAALTPRTRAIVVNSPGNPTGVVLPAETLRAVAELAARQNVLLISDEIYSAFTYGRPFASPAANNPDVLVVDGFSKSHGMTGWRLGYAHGPARLINEMAKLQQFTFVCAPSMVQHAGVTALSVDMSAAVAAYAAKRDRICAGLEGHYQFARPDGAFYVFPKAPWGTGAEFVTEAIRRNLLLIPGGTFSRADTHFRISYAASDATLDRGIAILRELARR